MASGNFFGRAYVFRLPMVDGDHMGQQKNHIVIIFSTFLCAYRIPPSQEELLCSP